MRKEGDGRVTTFIAMLLPDLVLQKAKVTAMAVTSRRCLSIVVWMISRCNCNSMLSAVVNPNPETPCGRGQPLIRKVRLVTPEWSRANAQI